VGSPGSHAYYISFNIFNNGVTFAGSKVCAYDRTSMLADLPATQQCFQLSNSFGGLLPSDLDGPASPPPPGTPSFFLNFGTNSLRLWKFHVDWGIPANTISLGFGSNLIYTAKDAREPERISG